MDWFKMQTIWGAPLKCLSDEEAGRFIKAVYDFIREGKECGGVGREEILIVQALETLKCDISAFERNQKDCSQERKDSISELRRNAALKRWGKTPANANVKQNDAENANGANDAIKNKNKNKNKNKEKDIETEKEKEVVENNDFASDSGQPIIGIDGTPLDLSRVQHLDDAEKLIKRFHMPQAETVLEAIADDIQTNGLETVENALKKASESDVRGGISLNFYRAVLANKGQQSKGGNWGAKNRDEMIKHTDEEKKESIRKAIVNLDDYE